MKQTLQSWYQLQQRLIRKIYPLILICGTALLPTPARPSGQDLAGQILQQVYGSFISQCVQTAVSTTNPNRVTGLTPKQRYVVYGYNTADFSGLAIKCIQGTSTVDVTGQQGKKIFAGNQEIWLVQGGNTAISCQTATGSGVYDVCALQ